MTIDACSRDDTANEAVWWYRNGGATGGPVSIADLQRLADGPLGPATLVWRKTFGERWRRLDATLATFVVAEGPPSVDHGPWARSFATFEATPERRQPSWLGVFGPFAYLYLGMWRRALVIMSVSLAFQLVFALADTGRESRTHLLPTLFILAFCVRNLKRDYYRFKVLGEGMWPRLGFMRHGFACAGTALVLGFAVGIVQIADPVDALTSDVAGVWQSDGSNVVIDVAGQTKTITYGGAIHVVRLASVDGGNGVIVFEDVRHPKTLITLQKHWSETRESYTLDLLVDDRLMGNLLYVRPV